MATDDLKHLSPKEIWEGEIEPAKVVVIKNITSSITEESLQNYLEVVTDKCLASLYFYPAVTNISLAVFDEEITDVENVQQTVQRRPLEKSILELLPLGGAIGLLLSDISGPVGDDALSLYFESKSCGSPGADVGNCKLLTDLNICIVMMTASPEVFKKIVNKSDHRSGGVTFAVEPYYPTFHDPVLNSLQTRNIKAAGFNIANKPAGIATPTPAVPPKPASRAFSPVYLKPTGIVNNSSESLYPSIQDNIGFKALQTNDGCSWRKDLQNTLPLSQLSSGSESEIIFSNNLDDETVLEHTQPFRLYEILPDPRQPFRSDENLQLTSSSSNTLSLPDARQLQACKKDQQKPLSSGLQIFTGSLIPFRIPPVVLNNVSYQPEYCSMHCVHPSEGTQERCTKVADSSSHKMFRPPEPHSNNAKNFQIAAVSPMRQGQSDVDDQIHLDAGEESDTVRLAMEEIQLLIIDCFPEKSKPCKINLDTKKELVRFSGQKNDVQTAKLKMYETLKQKEEMVSSSELTELQKKLFSLQETNNEVRAMLKSKHIYAVVLRKEDNHLHSYALKDSEAKNGLELIEQCLVQSTVSLREGQDKLLGGSEWTSLIQDIEKKDIIKVQENTRKVEIGGLHQSVVNQAKNKIITFFKQKTPKSAYKETVDGAIARCFKAELAESVREKLKSNGGSLKLQDLPSHHGSDIFQLEVEVLGSDGAIEIFKTALKSIWHEKLDFQRMCNSDEFPDEDIQLVKAALSRNGKDFLKRFEGRHHCYIDFTLPSGHNFEKANNHSEPYRKRSRKKMDSPARHHATKFDNSKPKYKEHAFPHKLRRGFEEHRSHRTYSARSHFQNGPRLFTTESKSLDEISDGMMRGIQIGQITVVVKQGDIVKEEAYALMNIVSPSRDLTKGSVISQSFVKAGGPELVPMYKDNVHLEEEGFVVTSGAGNLKCNKVFHVMLRTRINDTKREVRKVMRTCYKICHKYGVTHLALPPLGCGRLHGYDPNSVVEAMLDETSKLGFGSFGKTSVKKVTIVVFDQNICQMFLMKLSSLEALSSQSLSQYQPYLDSSEVSQDKEDTDNEFLFSLNQRTDDNQDDEDDDHGSGSVDNDDGSDDGCIPLTHSESSPAISYLHDQQLHGTKIEPRKAAKVSTVTVKVVAKDKQACLGCVNKLVKEMKENYLFESEPVDKKHKLPPEDKKKIKDILSKHETSVKQRVKGDAYILKGWKEEVYTAHNAILKVLSETSGTTWHRKVQHKRHSPGFWHYKAFEQPETPEYWSMGNNIIQNVFSKFMGVLKGKKSRLEKVDDATFQEIVKLVNDTWQKDLIGKGNDAVNLQHTGIQVSKIRRVENLDLYESYFKKRQDIFKSLCRSEQERFPQLDKIRGCRDGDIKTSRGGKCLTRDMYPEINEYYFFHGTKLDKIDAICENGLDWRLGSDKGMLGAGVYGAESSTKADQYTDSKQARTPGEKKMFLMRMVLGNIYVCTDSNPHKYRRPPCRTCFRDDCADAKHTQGYFDSVVGDMGKLFREFVVYDRNQCYPEYIITYTRT